MLLKNILMALMKNVTDYLDKLIQFPVKVPKISTREVRAYLFLLYASIHPTYGQQQDKLEKILERGWRKIYDFPGKKSQLV